MSAHELTVTALVWICGGTTALSCLGMAAVHDTFPRLHFMAPVANVSAIALLIAVGLQEGLGQALIKTAIVCGVLIVMNSVLAHATARAARVRQFGHWTAQPGETITGASDRGQREAQQDRRRDE